jgi:RimJ/RimL family protein N-acetyltransferase
MFMRTERLFLRPVFAEDWREILAGIGDFDVVRMLASAPWPYGEEQARAYCESQAAQGEIRLSVTLPCPAGAPVIGQVGLRPEAGGGHELGYWIGRDWQRRGFALEAVRGVVAIADALGIARIGAGHYLDNPASGKVLRRAGFVPTGQIAPTRCMGRDGETVMTRRYLRQPPCAAEVARPAAA